MDVDVAARRVALGAIPLVLVAAYFLRSQAPEDSSPANGGAAAASAVPISSGVRASESTRQSAPARPQPNRPKKADEISLPPPGTPARRRKVNPPPSMAVDLPMVRAPAAAAAVPLPVQERAGPCGGVLVRVITTSSDPQWSFATIADGPGKPARVRRVGDPVGPWRVGEIEWDRVWLRGASGRCAATVHRGEEPRNVGASASEGMLAPAEGAAPVWQVPSSVVAAIRQRSATEFEIDAEAVEEIFRRGSDLVSGVRLSPLRREGAVEGLLLEAIVQDSLLDRLGVESMDVVLTLNQHPVATLDAVIAALSDAKQRNRLVARLRRDHQDFDLEVAVRGE